MTVTTQPKIGHNSSKKLAPFNEQFEKIQLLSAEAARALEGHHSQIHQALVATYKLGLELVAANSMEVFLGSHLKSISAKQLKNDFHELVTIAFRKSRQDSCSKYRKVLKYAQGEKWSVEQFNDALKLQTFDGLYITALKTGKNAGDRRVKDDTSEQVKDAKATLAKTSLGTVTNLNTSDLHPHLVDGYANAVIRETPTGAEIVGFVPAGSKTVFERKLVELVPTIPGRREKKLSSKNLYGFFVICDVFVRLLPKTPEVLEQLNAQKAMQQTLDISEYQSKDDVVKALKARQSGDPVAGVTLTEIEAAKNVVWLIKQDGDAPTLVETGTTLPSMVAIEASLDWGVFKQKARFLQVAAVDAVNFTDTFLRQLVWTDEHTTLLSHVSANDDPRTKYGFPSVASGKEGFRVLKVGGNALHHFQATKGIVLDLSNWRDDFKSNLTKTSKRSYPKCLTLVVSDGFLWLTFPDNPMERRKLGKIGTGPANTAVLTSDWLLDSRQLDRVIGLAVDYGMTFEGRLLAMSGAPYAIELSCELPTGPCKLTMPLSVGLAGGLIENTDTFTGPAALPAPKSNEAKS